MEGAGLVAVLLALFAGYTYAVFKRTSADLKASKAGARRLASKRWSDLATMVPFIVLLILILRVYVEDM